MASSRLLCVLAIAGCSTTSAQLDNVWRAPDVQAGELSNVITFMPAIDGALRRSVEDKLARRLLEHGIRATPSYVVVRDTELRDRDHAVAALMAAGFDGLVAVRLVDAKQAVQYPTFDTFFGPWPAPPSSPIVHMQVDAYGLPRGDLTWMATTRALDPGSVARLADDVAQITAGELAKEHVITAQR